MVYAIYGVWWNGKSYDTVTKAVDTIQQALGAASLLLRECNPKQVWIIDEDNKSPIPDNMGAVACSLNKKDDTVDVKQMTLGVE